MNPATPKTALFKSWFVAWNIIYLTIIIFSLISPENFLLTIIKVGSIFLCTIYVITTTPKDYPLILAMVITSIADIILAINNTSIYGIITFVLAQLVHLVRLDTSRSKLPAIIFALTIIITLAIDSIFQFIPLIYLASALYATVIGLNFYTSLRWHQQAPKDFHAKCAFFGFLLFICCDLWICVSYLSLIESLPAFLYLPANFFAWFFYYPSQILISNSTRYGIMAKREGKCKMEVYGN